MAKPDTLDLGSWCILRMGSADTLKVFRELVARGIDVWTPVERRVGRRPRTQARSEKEVALMPSYVFGRVEHISELARLAMVPNRDMPRFSMFKYAGGFPLIADSQLAALREEEDRLTSVFNLARRRGKKGPKLEPGSEIKMTEGPFAGMSGIVEGQQGQFTLVDMSIFGKVHSIKIASLLLEPDVARDELPSVGLAA